MTVELKTNNSRHSCGDCIHRSYCNKNEEDLLKYAKQHGFQVGEHVFIPLNCPIISKKTKEKVIFT